MSSTILNDIVRDYESIAAAWFTALFPAAQAVFWILVAIELVWSAIWWAIDREDGLTVVTALLRKVVAVGFFYALLLNGNTWIPAVVSGFRQAGSTASRLPDLNPTGIFDQGLALANAILNSVEGLGLLEGLFPSLVAVFTALVVVAAFAIIASKRRPAISRGPRGDLYVTSERSRSLTFSTTCPTVFTLITIGLPGPFPPVSLDRPDPGPSRQRSRSALLRRLRHEAAELRHDLGAFAPRALHVALLPLRDGHDQLERHLALLAHEFVSRHGIPPVIAVCGDSWRYGRSVRPRRRSSWPRPVWWSCV